MNEFTEAMPDDWKLCPLGTLLNEVDVRVADLRTEERGHLEVLSLTKRFGLIPQSERFDKRVATENVDNYKVVRRGWIVYNPYVIWEGAIHALRRDEPGIVSPVYRTWKRTEDDFGYLDLILRTPELIAQYQRYSSGAVNRRRSIQKGDFLSIKVPMPRLPEQRNIAKVLRLFQRAIEQQEQLLLLTSELQKSLIRELFTHGLYSQPKTETELGPIPQNWNVGRLDSFCVLQRGFDITKKEQTPGSVPVVSSGGIASYHNVAKVKGPGVIVGRKGTLGKVHYVESDYWPHDTTLWVKDFKGNDPQFTAYFLETLRFERYDSGGSNPTLNRNTVHAQLVAYPGHEEQKDIGSAIRIFEEKIKLHRRKHATLTALFRTLLHELMTAQIRVHNLDLSALNGLAAAQ
jgi:type I restriction enzyme S subunit